jgi:hypothetical protein
VSGALFCPACGSEVLLDRDPPRYCSHVQYVYGWSADTDAFVFVAPTFARRYLEEIEAAGLLREHLADAGGEVTEEQKESFARGDFEPYGEVAHLFPDPGGGCDLRVSLAWSGHSGSYIGLNLGEGGARSGAESPGARPGLEDAIRLAVDAHRGQVDKAGAPYVLHPLRLMLSMGTSPERMAAVLHDVVEDSGITLGELQRLGYPPDVVDAVDALTRREGETYEDFVERAGRSPIARAVKAADLRDNMDLSRIAEPTEKDEQRAEKYRRALAKMEQGKRK